MKMNQPIQPQLRTREEIAKIIGISTRKLYNDIQKNEKLREKIPKRGLLAPPLQQEIFKHYDINTSENT
jgi:transcriptional antiterminator